MDRVSGAFTAWLTTRARESLLTGWTVGAILGSIQAATTLLIRWRSGDPERKMLLLPWAPPLVCFASFSLLGWAGVEALRTTWWSVAATDQDRALLLTIDDVRRVIPDIPIDPVAGQIEKWRQLNGRAKLRYGYSDLPRDVSVWCDVRDATPDSELFDLRFRSGELQMVDRPDLAPAGVRCTCTGFVINNEMRGGMASFVDSGYEVTFLATAPGLDAEQFSALVRSYVERLRSRR